MGSTTEGGGGERVELGGGEKSVNMSCQLSCHAMLCKQCVYSSYIYSRKSIKSNEMNTNEKQRDFTLYNG